MFDDLIWKLCVSQCPLRSHIWEFKIKDGIKLLLFCAGSTATGRPVDYGLFLVNLYPNGSSNARVASSHSKQLETRLEAGATCVLGLVRWQEWFAMAPSRITWMTGNLIDKINLQIRHREYTDVISEYARWCWENTLRIAQAPVLSRPF